MKKVFIISFLMLIRTTGFSQDSLKKTFVSIQFGGLKQLYVDDNERTYYNYWAEAHICFKTRKHFLVQTGLEYYKVNFYTNYLNSGPGVVDSANAFRFNKFCVPVYFNYISKKNHFIIGGGPVTNLLNNYTHSYVHVKYDPSTYSWSRQARSETFTNFSPLSLSLAAKADYLVDLGRLYLLIGLKFRAALFNETFYTDKGNSMVKFRDMNCSLNLGLVF